MQLPISRAAGAGGNKVSIPFVYRDRFLLCPGVLAGVCRNRLSALATASFCAPAFSPGFVAITFRLSQPRSSVPRRSRRGYRNRLSALATASSCAPAFSPGLSQSTFGSRERSLLCPGVLAGVSRSLFGSRNRALLCPGVLAGVIEIDFRLSQPLPPVPRRSRRGSSQSPFVYRNRFLLCPGVLAVWESRHPGGTKVSIPFIYRNYALLCPGVLAV